MLGLADRVYFTVKIKMLLLLLLLSLSDRVGNSVTPSVSTELGSIEVVSTVELEVNAEKH